MEKKVKLHLDTLLRECSKNKNLALDHFYYFSLENREIIHETFKYKKFNDDFTTYLACNNDENHIISNITPSYDEFLEKLLQILNVARPKHMVDDDKLTKLLLDRIEVLKGIKTEQELQSEFPIIYGDLINGRKYFDNLQRMKRMEGYNQDEYASGEHYYYGCALKRSLPNFIKTQSLMYTRYVTSRQQLKDKQKNKSYNAYIRKNFDMPRLYMYVIHEYLSFCEATHDLRQIEEYLELVEKYLETDIDKSVTITTKDGVIVTIGLIKQRYENLKKEVEDKTGIVEWVIVPDVKTISTAKKTSSGPRKISMSKKEVTTLQNIGERKRAFYATHPYIAKAIGLKKYHGYIAYIYENGEIILDREYNGKYPRTAKGNAIYNLKVEDFETLSKENKKVLMRHPRVGRIIHREDWEERVDKIISRPATEIEKEKTKQLIKRLQENKKQEA